MSIDQAFLESQTLRRQLLVVIYGGYKTASGKWIPDTKEVARRRRVSQRTVSNWISGATGTEKALEKILAAHRPRQKDLIRETLAHSHSALLLARVQAGRRGYLKEFDDGRLDPHSLLIVQLDGLPLCRPVVTRAAQERKHLKATDLIIRKEVFKNKFEAELARSALLAKVAPARLRQKKYTQCFLPEIIGLEI